MFETELKAKLVNESDVSEKLLQLARHPGTIASYYDRYFDTPNNDLKGTQRELRIRTICRNETKESVLTAKSSPFDESSRSKEEFEMNVGDPEKMEKILNTIGFVLDITLMKECVNYNLIFEDTRILATVVRIKELDETFLEVETLIQDRGDAASALDILRRLLEALTISKDDVTSEYYTDAVRTRRERGTSSAT